MERDEGATPNKGSPTAPPLAESVNSEAGAEPGAAPDWFLLDRAPEVKALPEAAPAADPADILGPKRPTPYKVWTRKQIKLLVVGDSGLGKTTLIRALLRVPGPAGSGVAPHDGSPTSAAQFRRDPDSLCSTVEWRDEADRVVWCYKVQDTPGYGDNLNVMDSIRTLVGYVENQNRAWLRAERDARRAADLAELEDPRVDLCLFCLQPHRLRPIDLRFMAELGRVVPILAIITKADTMTISEAAQYRQEVHARLHGTGGGSDRDAGPVNVFQFEDATLARAGLGPLADRGRRPVPPFLVVASNDVSAEAAARSPPLFWPERVYPWGVSQAFNEDHSDLLPLRRLLLKEAPADIAAAKRARYYAWRRQQLTGRRGHKLVTLAASLACVVGMALVLARGGGAGPLPGRLRLPGCRKAPKREEGWGWPDLRDAASEDPPPEEAQHTEQGAGAEASGMEEAEPASAGAGHAAGTRRRRLLFW